MKSDFVELEIFEKIFPYMTNDNRRAVSLSLQTGLRIGDVVALKRRNLNKKTCLLRYKAQKTGKNGEIVLPREMVEQLCRYSGKIYLFQGKNSNSHRTRQAVWQDVKKATERAGLTEHITPHSARKNFAVNLLRKTGDINKVQTALQHNSKILTEYYAHSDRVTEKSSDNTELISVIKETIESTLRDILPILLQEFFGEK